MRVLVVEDSLLVAEVIVELLQENGWDVVGPAGRVQHALVLVRTEPLDGALLDINLAGEFCFPIAAALVQRGVPFIFVTGYSDAAVVPQEYRAVPRVGKPFRYGELMSVAAQHFGGAPS
jgi:DNA-binding response OmpR family regulator